MACLGADYEAAYRPDGVSLPLARAIRSLTYAVSYHAFMTDFSTSLFLRVPLSPYHPPDAVPSAQHILQSDVIRAFSELDVARTRRENVRLRLRKGDRIKLMQEDESPLIELVRQLPWWMGKKYAGLVAQVIDDYEALGGKLPDLVAYVFVNEKRMLDEWLERVDSYAA